MGASTVERAECDAQWIGRVDVASPGRASPTIPPKVRRAVSRRHGDRCTVPGCRHASFVDVHHVERRADGGGHDPERLVMLCGAHHAAVHEGTLVIRGTYSAGFSFEHADGSAYGEASASPARSVLLAQVLVALVGMGWKQREAQAMVDRVRAHVGPETSVSEAMRRRVEGRAAEALRLRSLRLRAQGERNRRIRARSRPLSEPSPKAMAQSKHAGGRVALRRLL